MVQELAKPGHVIYLFMHKFVTKIYKNIKIMVAHVKFIA